MTKSAHFLFEIILTVKSKTLFIVLPLSNWILFGSINFDNMMSAVIRYLRLTLMLCGFGTEFMYIIYAQAFNAAPCYFLFYSFLLLGHCYKLFLKFLLWCLWNSALYYAMRDTRTLIQPSENIMVWHKVDFWNSAYLISSWFVYELPHYIAILKWLNYSLKLHCSNFTSAC